jgi:hypothetical protein
MIRRYESLYASTLQRAGKQNGKAGVAQRENTARDTARDTAGM